MANKNFARSVRKNLECDINDKVAADLGDTIPGFPTFLAQRNKSPGLCVTSQFSITQAWARRPNVSSPVSSG